MDSMLVGGSIAAGIVVVLLLMDKVFFMDIWGFGRRRAAAGFAQAAASAGLEHHAKGAPKLGEARGEVNGFPVRVDADQATLEVSLQCSGDFRFTSIPSTELPYAHLKPFESGSAAFDRLFPTRGVDPETAERLADRGPAFDRVASAAAGRARSVKFVQLTPTGVRCKYRFGNSRYLPAEMLGRPLRDLVALAAALEEAVGSSGSAPADAGPADAGHTETVA